MAKIAILVVIALLVVFSTARGRRRCVPHAPYTSSVLTLSWPGKFCGASSGKCNAGFNTWDRYPTNYLEKASRFTAIGPLTTLRT